MERTTRDQHQLHTTGTGSSNSILGINFGSRNHKRNKLHKNNHHRLRNYIGLGLYTIILSSFIAPVRAQEAPVANQSAVAAPTAVSSGSAVNQAVQVVNSQYFQQQYGSGVQCQGGARNRCSSLLFVMSECRNTEKVSI